MSLGISRWEQMNNRRSECRSTIAGQNAEIRLIAREREPFFYQESFFNSVFRVVFKEQEIERRPLVALFLLFLFINSTRK